MKRLWLVLTLAGCAYDVHLDTLPSGANVLLPNTKIVTTPADVRLVSFPFRHQWTHVTAPGYRPMTVDLRKSGKIELVLVPEHGPMGTWDATTEDLPH